MALIKDGGIAADDWRHPADGEALPAGKATVSLARWQAEKPELMARGQPLGVRLRPADGPEAIAGDLARLDLVVLDMGPFADGRVFSTARLLRDRLGYRGEIRVTGDFLRDQMDYLSRVGVNAFEFPEGTDLDNMLRAFSEFSVAYQAPAGHTRVAAAGRGTVNPARS